MSEIQWTKSSRDRLFFDRFRYCLNFRCKGIHLLRGLDETFLEKRFRLRQSMQGGLVHTTRTDIITEEDLIVLLTLLVKFRAISDEHHLMVSSNWAYLYHNDCDFLESFTRGNEYISQRRITEAILSRPRDVILQRKPKFAYRTYLRERMFRNRETGKSLVKFLSHQQDWKLSGSLQKALEDDYKYFYLQSHHYIEHDHPRDMLLLSLHTPGIIRKTCEIQAK